MLRASAALTGHADFVVIGSQALLASHPEAPRDLLRSMEVDLYSRDAPELADLVDGSIGELSPFHETFGYYAHGVSPETALLPSAWRGRLVQVRTPECVGWCLSPIDLAVSKLLAGRDRDFDFVRGLVVAEIVSTEGMESVIAELDPALGALLSSRLATLSGRG